MIRQLIHRLVGRTRRGLGARGEAHAARWLARQGYEILESNVVIARHEIDLLVRAPDGRTLVLVEVKTRASAMPPPEAAINREKRRRIIRAAQMLARRPEHAGLPMRFDVVAVTWPDGGEPQIRHFVSAFDAGGAS